MTDQKISKKTLWDNYIEKLKALHQADLDEPLEAYFYKTPSRITFIKILPANIKIKLIKEFFNIYDN